MLRHRCGRLHTLPSYSYTAVAGNPAGQRSKIASGKQIGAGKRSFHWWFPGPIHSSGLINLIIHLLLVLCAPLWFWAFDLRHWCWGDIKNQAKPAQKGYASLPAGTGVEGNHNSPPQKGREDLQGAYHGIARHTAGIGICYQAMCCG